MKQFTILIVLFLSAIRSQAQSQNSLSIGGGVTYPAFARHYDPSWFTSFQWNIRLGRFSSIDTRIDLAEIGVEDYPDAPGVENDHNVYQFGIGYRQNFMKRFFARGGVATAITNDGEASLRIFPSLGIGYNLFLTKRNGLEISLKNDLIKNFDDHPYFPLLSLGIFYKFSYSAKQ